MYSDDISFIKLTFDLDVDKKMCERFLNEVVIISIPYEDRKRDWMMLTVDSCRFKIRIERVSPMIDLVLKKHLKLISGNINENRCTQTRKRLYS